MAAHTVARRYAGALLEIGLRRNAHERFGEELALVAAATEPTLAILAGPALKKDEKKAVLAEVIKAASLAPEIADFLRLLVDKGRLGALGDIALAYRELAEETSGKITATVYAARPLDEAQLGELRVKLTRRLGKHVTIEQMADPSLIGGIRTRVGSLVIDGSLSGHLERFRGTVRKG